MKTIKSFISRSIRGKLMLTILCCICLYSQGQAQHWEFRPKKAEPCGEVFVDLTKGTVNGLKANADYEAANAAFSACSEAVAAMERKNDTEEYLSNSVGFRFFFGVETVEVWKDIKGKTSVKIWGKKPKVLDALFGEAEFKGDFHRIYKTEYGSLYADLDKRGKIELISMHTTTAEETWQLLCMDSGYCR